MGYWLLQAAIAAACILGLWAPWDQYLGTFATTLTWLYMPGLLVRSLNLSFSLATVTVTVTIILLTIAGALLKVSAGASAIQFNVPGSSEHSHPRNISHRCSSLSQLRLASFGTMLVSLGVVILMPPSGAIFFLIFLSVVQFLSYVRAKRYPGVLAPEQDIGVILPRRPNTAARWRSAVLSESFAILYALCLSVFAWRYNPHALLRCLLISLGLSLVARALQPADWKPISQTGNLGQEVSTK
ncbi:MAG: hypothetical protein ACR2JE_17990 [Acidobacteriaceae bacterium]